MKAIIFSGLFFLFIYNVDAQIPVQSVNIPLSGVDLNRNADQQISNTLGNMNNAIETSKVSIIKGEKVKGTPFLFDDWAIGTVILKDDKEYKGNRLSFDAYHQVLFFLSGTESLEVAGEVKTFTFNTPEKIMTFVNANEYKKQSKALYYEILVDGLKGTLLKTYRKVVESFDRSFVKPANTQYFKIIETYFYYNKNTLKIAEVGVNDNRIKPLLNITDEEWNKINLPSYDYSHEADLISLFKNFLSF